MVDITFNIGLLGMALILIAFVLNVIKHVKATDRLYLWLNCVGSALLIIYAVLLSSIPFMILNIVWTGAAVWGILYHGKKR
ncbi:TPA: hypothetical protein HA251_01290 [Candidatus Woesearchaeota archaeon]|nr:MAG: hypothetical protein UY85_C0084G0005 [Candidatus Peribacteria bacterium GW2011_GWB1_54_5]HIH23647.1 hypothetical protein [Candidatus Woesearchaeota archaeon]